MTMACECCSCDPNLAPYPDPYCREFNGPFQRQCDVHNSPGRMPVRATVLPISVQARIDPDRATSPPGRRP